MYTFLFIFLLFFNPVSPSSPDRYFKSLPSTLHRRHTFQEYLELTHPEPSDLLIPSCTLPVLHHSFGNTVDSPPFTVPYSPPSDCPSPWSRVVLDFHASCRGDQYDRIAALWLGGAEVLRTSTAEPTQTGIFWKVRKDITRYSSLLARSNLELTMMLENVVNEVFTGVYHINVTFFYYDDNTVRVPFSPLDDHKLDTKLGSEPTGGANMLQGLWNSYGKPADVIIPISDDRDKGFWFRIEGKSDVHSKIIRIPCNTRRAILELYVSFHGDDEFWYSNPPDSYIKSNHLPTSRGGGAYREVYVTIDEEFVASVVPFPVIFTGGINPLFWEPVVAIGAFNLPSYEFDLSPFLGNLVDGKNHNFSIGVADSIPFWLVDANLHIWLDHRKSKVKAKSIVIYPTPALSVKRRSKFKGLDGSFKIVASRKTRYIGWVKSKEEGNLTTHVTHEMKFKNTIEFQGNGTHKLVKQKIRTETEARVVSGIGGVVSRSIVKRRYPINIITSTVPRKGKDAYLAVTNVSHALTERFTSGEFWGSIYNRQDSNGWMEVKDHSVLAGEANTRQRFGYRDRSFCYSRTVAADNGWLTRDNSSFSCVSSS